MVDLVLTLLGPVAVEIKRRFSVQCHIGCVVRNCFNTHIHRLGFTTETKGID